MHGVSSMLTSWSCFPSVLLTPCCMLDIVVFPLLVLKSVPGKSDSQRERKQKWPSLAKLANSGFESVQNSEYCLVLAGFDL